MDLEFGRTHRSLQSLKRARQDQVGDASRSFVGEVQIVIEELGKGSTPDARSHTGCPSRAAKTEELIVKRRDMVMDSKSRV